ncbi:MAG: glutaredoxin family protein [Actinomycetales bacterium]|nr:glutaredoxin family protein [Candidatus Phosphoribacter baldrii]MBK6954511.1 glutaredoxin family protein [Candidatus Phosphoribacter baldrii]MBK7612116.1 glutaredoxin family protein [Candidatus Phosphoribacter baldrii]HRC12814.1 glutaredoxin family protein [Dermatophilaceae bacterium]
MFWRRSRGREVDPGEPRIVLIGRPGCHLCDDAEAIIARVAAESETRWVKVSVDDDPDLLARWGDQVPVTLVDGRPHDFYRVSENRLRAALKR